MVFRLKDANNACDSQFVERTSAGELLFARAKTNVTRVGANNYSPAGYENGWGMVFRLKDVNQDCDAQFVERTSDGELLFALAKTNVTRVGANNYSPAGHENGWGMVFRLQGANNACDTQFVA